jgi:CBS domain-containing protein
VASALDHIRVQDAMRHGIMTCSDEEPLREVARIMAAERVHAVAITKGTGRRPIGVVSDREVVAAVASGAEPTAGQAARDSLGISAGASLDNAARMMVAEGVAHLVVKDSASGYPIGILSTLDIAAAYARRSSA